MAYPKVGDKVKAVELELGSEYYLTKDAVYTVKDKWGSKQSFTIQDDNGLNTLCRYPECAHARWEIVK